PGERPGGGRGRARPGAWLFRELVFSRGAAAGGDDALERAFEHAGRHHRRSAGTGGPRPGPGNRVMSADKPSKNEDEYFARREAEILKASRDAAARASNDAERRSHFMRCPKCGGKLKTEEYHGIQVDRCPD